MKKIFIISFLTTFTLAQQTTSYSWEDGNGTILGTYCYGSCNGVVDQANVGPTSGVNPYDFICLIVLANFPMRRTIMVSFE